MTHEHVERRGATSGEGTSGTGPGTHVLLFEDDDTLSRVMLRFKSLQSEALPKGASRDLIARTAEERWKDQTS